MPHIILQKQCSKCKKQFPATLEYFLQEKRVRDGLSAICRDCKRAYLRNYIPSQEVRDRRNKAKRENEEYRRKENERQKERRKDPEYRERENARQRESNQDPLYREARYRAKNEQRRKRYADDPEYRDKVLRITGAHSKLPDVRIRANARRRERYAEEPEYRELVNRRECERAKTEAGRTRHAVLSQRRRAKVRGSEGTHTAADIDLQYRTQNGKCWHCGKELNGTYEIDHLIPLSKGGTNWPNNLVCSCRKCNRSKGDKLPQEWNGKLF
jgi:5-methylcytosine-specific restriction endonuclease McrA